MADDAPQAAGTGGDIMRQDLNIAPFLPPTDPDDAALAWIKWMKTFAKKLRFFRVTSLQDRMDALSIYGGEEIDKLLETLPDPDNPPDLPTDIKPEGAEDDAYFKHVQKLNGYFTTMVNKDSARSRFDAMTQGEMSMAKYFVQLKEQAEKCSYADRDDTIRTKLLQTMKDKKLRRDAMLKGTTLSALLKQAANKEDVERQAKEMEKEAVQVHRVYEQKQRQKPGANGKYHKKYPPRQKGRSDVGKGEGKGAKCEFCGYNHEGGRAKCPASGKTCKNCARRGHFAAVCSAPKKHHQARKVTAGAAGGVETDSDSSECAFSVKAAGTVRPTVKVRIGGVKGQADADSCSSANVMDKHQFDAIASASEQRIVLEPALKKLYAYAQKEPIRLAGKFRATVRSLHTGKEVPAEFLVVEGRANSRPLLSLETAVKLGVLHVTNLVNLTDAVGISKVTEEYRDVFSGLGRHKHISAKLIVDETVVPIAQKQRSVPYNLEKKVRAEEERLKALGVLEDVSDDVPTTWCTNPVVAPKPRKPDAIRYCSNMRVPNVAILRPTTEALTVEDVRVRLGKAKCFSILDMNEAYHQLELDPVSRHMTTFHGTTGRMRYTRLNYGTISAQDIFDKAMDDTIHGLTGVLHIRDDFVVYGEDQQQHDAALRAFLERFRECGLTLSPKKCKIGVPQIEFFGLIFSKEGVSPAPSKIEALRKMSKPADPAEVRSLLGMAQYSSQFIPNFSELTSPLRELTKSTSTWKWGKAEEDAFKKLQSCLSDSSVLGYYEVGQETRLMVDAGPNGLGLILFQKKKAGWQPVACASRSLTDVEKRYSQMEREALAIRWACERCYVYLIASPRFTIITDHQPLLPMFNNPNSRPPLRVERWLMYLQQFDFKLEFSPGKTNGADYLSRHALPLTSHDTHVSNRRDAIVRLLVQCHVPRALTLEQVKEVTASDDQLSRLIPHIISGKRYKVKEDPVINMYHQVFPELSLAEGIVLRGDQLVIPDGLQQRVLDICHEGHLGIVKSKQLLRSKVWFPGIDRKMENKCKGCIPCQAAVIQKQRCPLRMTPTPDHAWQSVAADFCGPFPTGELVLVVIDEKSRYPAVEIINSMSAKETIPAMENIFATHGLPESLKSDNGPPFQSKDFRQFCLSKGIKHHRITPLWPESNGLAENFMKTVGKAARTAHSEGKDWRQAMYVTLANYRATPHPSTGKSPSMVLMGREPRTKLPSLADEKPSDGVLEKDIIAKRKQKEYADVKRNVRDHGLKPGDIVLARQPKQNKLSTPYDPVPYCVDRVKGSMVTAEKGGKKLTRNSSAFKKVLADPQLVPVEEPVEIPSDEEEEPHEVLGAPDIKPVREASPPRQTRSGRNINLPSKYQDFVM